MRHPDPGAHRAPREPRHAAAASSGRPGHRGLTLGLVVAVLTGVALLVASAWPTITATPEVDTAAYAGAAAERDGDLRASRSQARGTEAVSAAAEAGVTYPRYQLAPRPKVIQRVPGRTITGQPTKVVPGIVLRRLPPEPPEPAEPSEPPEPAEPVPGDPFSFRVATFNILGSQHTRGSRRYASGTTRAGFVADLVTSRGIDVIGMQEVQDDQLAVLQRRLPGYGIWPAQSLGGNGQRLQLAWRTDLFEFVEGRSFDTTFDHQRRPIPYVLLRHRETGAESWHMVIHNSPRDQEGDRDAATGVEIGVINQLRATGTPVFVTGDMNEKEEWFCRVGSETGLAAANGGSTSGGCVLPPRPLRIDWIMGGGGSEGGLAWSGYVRDTSELVQRTSDHDFLYATATVTPLVGQED
jgi:endonuclease/exonuclease/phosphatase family metal-dependent hydrolase